MFPASRSREVLGACRAAQLEPVRGDRTMFDFGSIFQQVTTEFSDLFVNRILGLMFSLFGGLLG
jgi:hypothetical protein